MSFPQLEQSELDTSNAEIGIVSSVQIGHFLFITTGTYLLSLVNTIVALGPQPSLSIPAPGWLLAVTSGRSIKTNRRSLSPGDDQPKSPMRLPAIVLGPTTPPLSRTAAAVQEGSLHRLRAEIE